MKYKFNFENMPEYASLILKDIATAVECQQMLINLVGSSEWIVGTHQLIDFQESDLSKLTPEDVREIATTVSVLSDRMGNGKTAFVVMGVSAVVVMDHYENTAKIANNEGKIFDNKSEAVKWLLS